MKRIPVLFLLLSVLTGCAGTTVLQSEDFTLSNTEFSYYYWSEFFYVQGVYGSFADADFNQPLDKQMYDETRSWQDYLTDQTLTMVKETMSLVFAAQDAGHELSEEYEKSFETVMADFTADATEKGYKTMDAYLKDSYGRDATEESFRQYLYCTHLAASYDDALYAACAPTEEEAKAYLEQSSEADLAQATENLHMQTYKNAQAEIFKTYSFAVNREKIRITAPKGLYD